MGVVLANGIAGLDAGGFAAHGFLGADLGRLGFGAFVNAAELSRRDEDPWGGHTECFTTLTVGPAIVVHDILWTRPTDMKVARRVLDLSAHVGPSYTWVDGDPADSLPDGTSGPGVSGGVRLEWGLTSIGLWASVDDTYAWVSRAGKAAPDVAGGTATPAASYSGNVITLTFGIMVGLEK